MTEQQPTVNSQARRIGVQGDAGSFSELAGQTFSERHNLDDAEIIYLTTSENVLNHLTDGKIDIGIMAMENAQGGVVVESVIALAAHKCHIVEMFHIQVEQCLLGLPNLALGDVSEVHSHQQALRQCRNYLADNFWTRPLVEEEDTALAAARLAEGILPETAAVVGNRTCAELYGLTILAENIQDLKNNLTMFLALERMESDK